jgi:uncharacterized membrane protein
MNPVTLPAAWGPQQSPAWRMTDRLADGDAARVAASDGQPDWSLQRRCSLTPAQFGAFFLALGLVSSLVAVFFWAMGAPVITLFAGAEIAAVALAFAWHALHAADGEQLRLHEGQLQVLRRQGLRSELEQWPLAGLRVGLAADGSIELSRLGRFAQLGRQADRAQCRQVLAGLRRALATSLE